MQMRPALQIQSMIKAMMDVVLPAVDPSNKLALEQSRLVIGMLSLMAQQLPLQFRFDCDELSRLLKLAAALQHAARGGPQTTACIDSVAAAASAAAATLDQAKAGPEAIEQSIHELRAATSQLVRAAYRDGETAALQQVESIVLNVSKDQLLRDRSWLLMQAWEADPAALPKIQDLLANAGG